MSVCVEVKINGSTTLSGIVRVSARSQLNAPTTAQVVMNNFGGSRQFSAKRGDLIQIKASPRKKTNADGLPIVFYGYISDIETTRTTFSLLCSDALGYLSNEIVMTNPSAISASGDASDTVKEIVGGSSYNLPPVQIIGKCGISISAGLDLVGKTRLEAIQIVMAQINQTPNKFQIQALQNGTPTLGIVMNKMPVITDSTVASYIAGRLPRTSAPQDLYPTSIDRIEDDSDLINFVTIRNKDKGIEVNVPAVKPSSPIQRLFDEPTIIDESQAILFGSQIIEQQGRFKSRWSVQSVPERFDMQVGDLVEFASVEGGLAGVHQIFDMSWQLTADGSDLKMTVGRQTPNLVSAIRYATNLFV